MGLVGVRVGNQLGNHSFPCFCLFVLQHLPWHGALDTEIFSARASQAVGDTSVTRFAHNNNRSIFYYQLINFAIPTFPVQTYMQALFSSHYCRQHYFISFQVDIQFAPYNLSGYTFPTISKSFFLVYNVVCYSIVPVPPIHL